MRFRQCKWYGVKLKWNIKIGRYSAVYLWWCLYKFLKKRFSDAYVGPCQTYIMKLFLQKWVMSFSHHFNKLNIILNMPLISFTVDATIFHNCLKKTCQIFRIAIFKDVSESLIFSYYRFSLFTSIWIFVTALYRGRNSYCWFLLFLKNLEILCQLHGRN